jgi:hypothetical protein
LEGLVKKFLIAAVAALALAAVATTASAQHGGGGGGGHSGGGGGWHGGSGGGGWHGGGGGSWHGHGGHDGHSHFGFAVGFPFYWPYYYGYYPYGYYPYGYGYPYYDGYSSYYDAGPQTYIQRDTGDAIAPPGGTMAPAGPPQRSQYSYYCTDPAGYYPQIANCPSGWLTVVPNSAPRAAPAPY